MIGFDFFAASAFLLALGVAGFAVFSGIGKWRLGKSAGAPSADVPVAERALYGCLAGFTVTGWVLYGCDLLAIPWTRSLLVGMGLVAGALGFAHLGLRTGESGRNRLLAMAREGAIASRLVTLGGLAVVLGAVLVFSVATIPAFDVQPDYVYHWGPKAQRFYLEQGIDWEYLARPWNHHLHPDYPNLVPTLTAASMQVGLGEGSKGPVAWSAVAPLSLSWMALLALALWLLARDRPAGEQAGSSAPSIDTFASLAVGIAIWGMVGFAIGHELAGGADLPMALAMTAGACVLARRPRNPADAGDTDPRATDRQVAWVAAFAAAIKIEGMVLGAVLVALHLLRRSGLGKLRSSAEQTEATGNSTATVFGRGFLPSFLRTCGRTSWPLFVTLAFWAWGVSSHGLFLESNTGQLELGRIAIIVPELARTLALPEGLGLPLLLLAWPFLLIGRESRLPALLIGAQLAFYLYAYLSGPVDTAFWIRTSAPRLAFHVLPALAVLLVVELDRRTR